MPEREERREKRGRATNDQPDDSIIQTRRDHHVSRAVLVARELLPALGRCLALPRTRPAQIIIAIPAKRNGTAAVVDVVYDNSTLHILQTTAQLALVLVSDQLATRASGFILILRRARANNSGGQPALWPELM